MRRDAQREQLPQMDAPRVSAWCFKDHDIAR
jgi:hypothetical protein